MTDIAALSAALESIADPLGQGGLISAKRAAAPRFSDGTASLVLDVSGLDPAQRDALEKTVQAAVSALSDVQAVRIAMTSARTNRRIIAVASGKGGVGKSTVSVNLAIALRNAGHKVGLVDADIYGPSQARLTASEGEKPESEAQKMRPIITPSGLPLLSMGHLVKTGQAIAWRGPMASNALAQLIDAHWGDVDVLIVDMPPGTGDVQLSMVQKHKPAGVVIVSTPQDLALIDATRAIDLFNTAAVPIIGLVENMAGYACPHCGEVSDPFGNGGAEFAAGQMDLPFLGRIPLKASIRIASDAGAPPATGEGDDAEAFSVIAKRVTAWLSNS